METSNFVKQLSSNQRTVREKSLEALEKLISEDKLKNAKQFQFDKLWKGLYYAMWFSDKPRPQQRLANKLGELYMLCFHATDNKKQGELTENDKTFIKLSRAFWKVICIEWFNIDRYRLDKFYLLIRRVLFNQLKYLMSREWNEQLVDRYIEKVLGSIPLSGDSKVYNGVPLHIMDIFFDEWERVYTDRNDEFDEDEGEVDPEQLKEWVQTTPLEKFMQIFVKLNADTNTSKTLRVKIRKELLTDSRLKQWGINPVHSSTSEESAEESDKEEAEEEEEEWKGF
ncbi:Rrp1p KNAG_0H02930 [Huiozyma naganishii CBS 8797]|uniref:Ribosomal RNA-processing protein 1 n=1 Tax=Huiozyma naganishii (strain ATCC MYA-139 / BCRC 22969 / CBS 8797 / KCTC 17520 / NBRC 10181 / NCYC 3082 / Yp74L-3) TaxID=1071383 RepID=J7RPP5_HUIN7|nr:hypothetical protein KNAG_0H02930 [Kazachstania naganishii CBS 8797]CCK71708.1 hypothetical protein KNAG_0H02930 [Kazachstania naganishii CBS 8797]